MRDKGMRGKRNYTKKIEAGLAEHKDELIELMRDEWDETRRKASREEMVRKATAPILKGGEVLLALLAIGGLCCIALVAPKVFVLFNKRDKRKYFAEASSTKRTLYYLKRRKCIDLKEGKGGEYEIVITEKGLRLALQKGFSAIKARNKKWDGFWRIVIFDIPERHKTERDAFRDKLKHLGFYGLQQSVFVSPYQCDKEVEVVTSVLGITSFVTFAKAKDVSCKDELVRLFRL